MIIREIVPDDLNYIHSLSRQLGYEYSKEKTAARIDELKKSTNDKIFTAVDPHTKSCVGYIHLQLYKTLYYDSVVNILGLVVEQDLRNKGIGSLLIKKAEEYAKLENCAGIRANSSAARMNAHEFYRKNGFIDEKDQKRFLKLFKSS